MANTGVMRRIAARPPLRRLRFSPGGPADPAELLELEWIVTNGIGGYASGTVAGVPTRRYHGLLVAALGTPLGRTLMLNHLSEEVRLPDGTTVRLGGEERLDALDVDARHLIEFRLESGLPIWSYDLGGGHVLEKSIVLLHGQNTVHVSYRLAAGDGPVRLKLYPGIDVRPHDAPFSAELTRPYRLTSMQDRFELDASGAEPPLRLRIHGQHTVFTVCWRTVTQLQHRTEAARGYGSVGALCRPGHFRATLTRDHGATLVASTEPWEVVQALSPTQALEAERMRRARLIAQAHPSAHSGPAAELVLAADAFLVTPSWRVEDTLRAQASGTTARSVIAGYHWFTDWGRDTMISLEGLCLSTGRHDEARQVLLTFARYVKDGLIPNLFPEGANEGLYNTADATLWFFHAVDRYVDVTGDDSILQLLVPTLREVVGHHLQGTRFGIGVDPADGLLRQHADGFALTWMDAKMGDWVVTPRRGKAVEINALWFNALRLLAGWIEELDGAGHARWLEDAAERCRQSFNARFWRDDLGHLLDVVDGPAGDDPACRPNQVFAIALRHPVLDEARWGQVLEVVEQRLLTPVGLRSLAPGHPDYKPRYFGDLRARDAAYHQGTVWGWLIGPFVDAWLKVHPDDKAGARRLLQGFVEHLDQACVGTISEVFDAEGAYTARGCIAQAWSVAEALRVWVKTADSPES